MNMIFPVNLISATNNLVLDLTVKKWGLRIVTKKSVETRVFSRGLARKRIRYVIYFNWHRSAFDPDLLWNFAFSWCVTLYGACSPQFFIQTGDFHQQTQRASLNLQKVYTSRISLVINIVTVKQTKVMKFCSNFTLNGGLHCRQNSYSMIIIRCLVKLNSCSNPE